MPGVQKPHCAAKPSRKALLQRMQPPSLGEPLDGRRSARRRASRQASGRTASARRRSARCRRRRCPGRSRASRAVSRRACRAAPRAASCRRSTNSACSAPLRVSWIGTLAMSTLPWLWLSCGRATAAATGRNVPAVPRRDTRRWRSHRSNGRRTFADAANCLRNACCGQASPTSAPSAALARGPAFRHAAERDRGVAKRFRPRRSRLRGDRQHRHALAASPARLSAKRKLPSSGKPDEADAG